MDETDIQTEGQKRAPPLPSARVVRRSAVLFSPARPLARSRNRTCARSNRRTDNETEDQRRARARPLACLADRPPSPSRHHRTLICRRSPHAGAGLRQTLYFLSLSRQTFQTIFCGPLVSPARGGLRSSGWAGGGRVRVKPRKQTAAPPGTLIQGLSLVHLSNVVPWSFIANRLSNSTYFRLGRSTDRGFQAFALR